MTVADRFMQYVEDNTPFVVQAVPSRHLKPGKCVPPTVRGSCTWVVSPEDYAEIVRRFDAQQSR